MKTPLDTVMAMRRRHRKPSVVVIDLDAAHAPRPAAFGPPLEPDAVLDARDGIVNVVLTPDEPLGDVDFRALTGLVVHLHSNDGDTRRHRRAARLIAAVDPAHLVMPLWEGTTLVVHHRWASAQGVRNETVRVERQ